MKIFISITFKILFFFILTYNNVFSQILWGPVLSNKIESTTTFDTTSCGTTKCRWWKIYNDGDMVLSIDRIVNHFQLPFSCDIEKATFPIKINPGDSSEYSFCYSPTIAPKNDRLSYFTISTNNRSDKYLSLVFDISESMSFPINATDTTAKLRYLKNPVDSLINSLPPKDLVAIYSFHDVNAFTKIQDYIENHYLLRNKIPSGTTQISIKSICYAIEESVKDIQYQQWFRTRAIVIFTDGNNISSGDYDNKRLQAIKDSLKTPNEVHLFIIVAGDTTNIRTILNKTGGEFFQVKNYSEIINAFITIGQRLNHPSDINYPFSGTAVKPVMELQPNPINFDSVAIESSKCLPVTIKNTGTGDLRISETIGPSQPFKILTTNIPVIKPNQTHDINICFTPTETGIKNDAIKFLYNSCTEQDISIPINGVGVPAPVLQIEKSELNFDTTFCGTNKCKEITLKNIGLTDFIGLSFDKINTPFTCDSSGPFNIKSGDSIKRRICYNPQISQISDTLSVNILYNKKVFGNITLIGKSASPILKFSPATLNFDSVQIRDSSCLPVIISNEGDAPLDITSISTLLSPFKFEINPIVPIIPPGGQSMVNICFNPIISGLQTGLLDITYRSCATVKTQLQIRGTGFIVKVIPDPVNFDTCLCGTYKTKKFFLRNVGDVSVTINSIDILNNPFSGNIKTPITINAGESISFDLTYHPQSAPKLDSQIVTFRDNFNITQSFIIRGRSVAPLLNLNPKVINFDSVQIGKSKCVPLTIQNDGDAALNISNISDIKSPFRYQNLPDIPKLLPGEKYTLNTCFTPINSGAVSSTIDIEYPVCEQEKIPINVSGIGYSIKLVVDSIDFDTTLCGTKKCSKIKFNNLGDVAIRMNSIDPFIAPFSSNITIPFLINAKDSVVFDVYYFPNAAPKKDSQLISIKGENNISNIFIIKGRAVKPVIILEPANLNFDNIKVGQSKCLSLITRNEGDASYIIQQSPKINLPFSFNRPPIFPITIKPHDRQILEICFTPNNPLEQIDTIIFPNISCDQNIVQLQIRGSGVDSLTVALNEVFHAKPGSKINIPIRMLKRLPAEYNISSGSFNLSFNKTMLYPLRLITENTLSSALVDTSWALTFGENDATVNVNLKGGMLINPMDDSVLFKINCLVLFGNSMVTPIKLNYALFGNDKIPVQIIQPGYLYTDSICYQSDRLIKIGTGNDNILMQNSPNPFNPSTKIIYYLKQSGWTKLKVYNILGKEIKLLINEWEEKGIHEVIFDGSKHSSGIYYYKIESDYFMDVKKMLLLK